MTLAAWMEQQGIAPGAMADRINAELEKLGDDAEPISHKAVRKWVRGERIPRAAAVAAIWAATKGQVGPVDWYPRVKELSDAE